ncbi:Lead, cadmium, zinc and mercury transporting ATPase; Copper-translocating P-type ATPase [Thioalkalivibrio nitratireducens DSM 14787]|uniref:P-type Zn(2+) transporter n=1 Tax=Thioalkalivibrio nitratireducens (strain DSM 14787 / UNIQEM 213 / ALEN2) TaxID=1255043 RepID=L0DVC5_THIND|nr:heavy metal translocating P-type ATPase [Thioalkalivibrio nitratireducens]AGA32311.1 Lead, cadmium, zinc and mercury transporting ATPase; Copper-translocating P-type ATPase [Thioalkalivibrio nitratireducens DSM 14787]
MIARPTRGDPRLVHRTPTRLRFQLARLGDPRIDFAWLEAWLESVPGVEAVRINRHARCVVFDYDGAAGTRRAVRDRLRALPSLRIPAGEAEPTEPAELAPMIASLVVLVLLPFLSPPLRRLVTLVNISKTLLRGVDTFIHRGLKIEVLDAVAIGLSAGRGEHFTANATDFLMELGGYLEKRTERQSDRMLRRLLRPEPGLAWVERGGVLVQIPDDQIRTGERVEVGPGEKIGVDGLVLDGTALVNQSSITGEPVPVRKELMDRVIAGTVIEDGRLRIEARHVGDETTTARIARFIDASLDKPSDTQRMAERLADRRVYITLGTGALVYGLTGDGRRLSSVFLVDYSCALKLGTPLAFRSGIYHAARSGILLKGGEAIEHLAEIDTVVFDKTGTLTRSDLEVSDVVVLNTERWSRTRLLAVTASIEEHASHPIAEAIVRKAREEKLNHIDHGEVDYLVAHGMTCPVNGDRLLIGSRHFLEEHHGVRFDGFEAAIAALQEEGKTLLYVGTEQEAIGLIALRDTLREDAAAVLAGLRRLGVKHLVMLTGDHRRRADALARELGIDEVFAEQVPEDKARVLEQLRAEGRRVAFVGDGVNDGPALAAADVGIAMSRGTELARATADVVLLEDRLDMLLDAVDIAQRTMGMVATNYRAAIGINTGVMIGAALGWLSPVATAVLHNGTTVGLLVRALRGLDAREHPVPALSKPASGARAVPSQRS